MLISFEDGRRKQVFINPHLVSGVELDEGGTQSLVSTMSGRVYTVNDTPANVAAKLLKGISGDISAMVGEVGRQMIPVSEGDVKGPPG